MAAMRSNFFRLGVLLAVLLTAARAQNAPDNPRVELANLRQDMADLRQRVGQLELTIDQLNRDNAALQAKAGQSFVTIEQFNRSVADINRSMQSALSENKRETLNQVSGQMERLAKQTQAAIDALAKNQATRPPVQTSFSEDFPKEGVNYTVVNGDTLSGIAKKTGGKLSDIRNANKITDDSKVRVGQTLFIPNGK